MERKYPAHVIGKIAQETARKAGCQAVQWWQNDGEPDRLYITAKPILLSRQALVVQLTAILPQTLGSSTPKPD